MKCGGGEVVMVMETSEMTMIGKCGHEREWNDDNVEMKVNSKMVTTNGKRLENAF